MFGSIFKLKIKIDDESLRHILAENGTQLLTEDGQNLLMEGEM